MAVPTYYRQQWRRCLFNPVADLPVLVGDSAANGGDWHGPAHSPGGGRGVRQVDGAPGDMDGRLRWLVHDGDHLLLLGGRRLVRQISDRGGYRRAVRRRGNGLLGRIPDHRLGAGILPFRRHGGVCAHPIPRCGCRHRARQQGSDSCPFRASGGRRGPRLDLASGSGGGRSDCWPRIPLQPQLVGSAQLRNLAAGADAIGVVNRSRLGPDGHVRGVLAQEGRHRRYSNDDRVG